MITLLVTPDLLDLACWQPLMELINNEGLADVLEAAATACLRQGRVAEAGAVLVASRTVRLIPAPACLPPPGPPAVGSRCRRRRSGGGPSAGPT